MLQRKLLSDLLKWKKNKNKEVLLVKGARQVGKTYLIDQFGRDNYKSYLYINFIESPELKNIFSQSLNANEIYKMISLYFPKFKFIENNTLFFLDEIQQCPNARAALKFLAIDNKYDFIASGSLLGITYNEVSSLPVGYEKQIELFPLDFEEFLWALGYTEDKIQYLKSFYDKKLQVPEVINNLMLKTFRTYIVLGGMPSVVNKYLQSQHWGDVSNEQQKIIDLYLDDISKYAVGSDKAKATKAYLSIPNQLSKENTKFKYSIVDKSYKANDMLTSLDWLINSRMVNCCYNISYPQSPLEYNVKDNQFKIYCNDSGLLIQMFKDNKLKQSIINNTFKSISKGGIYENIIATFLIQKHYPLYYYKTIDNTQEIEFLINGNNIAIPIEVKAGGNKAISLKNYKNKFNPEISYKLNNGNIGYFDNILTLPLYMMIFFPDCNQDNETIEQPTIFQI